MTITVTSALLEGLVNEAELADPQEACGLLFGDENAVSAFCPTANVHPEPATHFEIDPQALIDAHRAMRAGGPRIVGYYHSHPRGLPHPSSTDRAMAAGDGSIWAIVGQGEVRLWRAGPNGFSTLSYMAV